MIIIKVVINKHSLENNLLSGILQRITTLTQEFEEIRLHHVKRSLNPQADLMAKEASRKLQGDFFLNNERGALPIP
jgi:hypothetical protein